MKARIDIPSLGNTSYIFTYTSAIGSIRRRQRGERYVDNLKGNKDVALIKIIKNTTTQSVPGGETMGRFFLHCRWFSAWSQCPRRGLFWKPLEKEMIITWFRRVIADSSGMQIAWKEWTEWKTTENVESKTVLCASSREYLEERATISLVGPSGIDKSFSVSQLPITHDVYVLYANFVAPVEYQNYLKRFAIETNSLVCVKNRKSDSRTRALRESKRRLHSLRQYLNWDLPIVHRPHHGSRGNGV